MDIKTIRESVNALRQIEVSKLDPRTLSEGLNQMQALHRETAAIVATDAKMSWDGAQVHESLNALEKAWHDHVQAPAATAAKLQEAQSRTLKVLKEACGIGIKYRAQLAEAVKAAAKKATLLAEVAKRGNDWRKRAQRAESQLAIRESSLDLAYASLDQFVERYHEDTAKLGRAMLMLEFKGKIEADPALLKRVNEAKRLEALNLIKEELAGKKPAAPAIVEAKADPVAPVAPVAPVTPVTPPKPAAPTSVQVTSSVRQFTVAESVASTLRLSNATALLG